MSCIAEFSLCCGSITSQGISARFEVSTVSALSHGDRLVSLCGLREADRCTDLPCRKLHVPALYEHGCGHCLIADLARPFKCLRQKRPIAAGVASITIKICAVLCPLLRHFDERRAHRAACLADQFFDLGELSKDRCHYCTGTDGVLCAPLDGQHVGQESHDGGIDSRRVTPCPRQAFLLGGVQGAEQGHASKRGGAPEHRAPVDERH